MFRFTSAQDVSFSISERVRSLVTVFAFFICVFFAQLTSAAP